MTVLTRGVAPVAVRVVNNAAAVTEVETEVETEAVIAEAIEGETGAVLAVVRVAASVGLTAAATGAWKARLRSTSKS